MANIDADGHTRPSKLRNDSFARFDQDEQHGLVTEQRVKKYGGCDLLLFA